MTRYLSASDDEPNREALELVRKSPLPPVCSLCTFRHPEGLHGPSVATRTTGNRNTSLKGLAVMIQTWTDRERGVVTYLPAIIRVPQGLAYVRFQSGASKHVIWQCVWQCVWHTPPAP